MFCPSSAFIVEKEYEIPDLVDNDEVKFKLHAADVAAKYPNLKNAYGDLLECWNHYHQRSK